MRALVLLLVLANLAFFALAQGWLQPVVGLARHNEREPQRLAAQLNADAVHIVTAEAADRTEAAAPASAADCPPLVAGDAGTADGCAAAR